jgi:sulfonate transport system permease protein
MVSRTLDLVIPPSATVADAGSATADRPVWSRRPWAALLRLRRLSGLAGLVVLWQVLASRGVLGAMTPTPWQVATAGYELARSGELAGNLAVSLSRVGRGLAIGLSVGLVLGLVSGLSRLGEDVVDAPVQALRMLPAVALAPIFIIWFGLGETSKVALISIAPLFPLYINVLGGIRAVDNRLVESARSCGVGRWGLIRRVILPGALPQIFIGLRQSLGVAWIVLVVAEQTATTSGLGVILSDAKDALRIDIMFVVVVVYAVLGLATDVLVRFLERRFLAWRRGYTGG